MFTFYQSIYGFNCQWIVNDYNRYVVDYEVLKHITRTVWDTLHVNYNNYSTAYTLGQHYSYNLWSLNGT